MLARSEVFDQFMQLKFPNLKRYGLEGGESMLPALDALFASSAQGTPVLSSLGLLAFRSLYASQLVSSTLSSACRTAAA